jgi:hypothetical protein
MTESDESPIADAPAPDYAELRSYLVASAMQDLGAADLTPEKRQQAVQNRLTESLSH